MAATPEELIADARNYAISVSQAATSALSGAMNTINQIGQGSLGGEGPKVTLTLPTPGDPGTVPEYHGTRALFKEFTGVKPTLDPVGNLNFPPDPGAGPNVLPFNEPAKPLSNQPDPSLLAGVPVVNTAFAAPTAPDLSITAIQVPTINDVVLPAEPAYIAPEFTGVKPVLADTPPTDIDQLIKSEYSTILPIMRDNATAQMNAFIDYQFPQMREGLATLEARLATYMNGGTALSPAVETAIYARALDKTDNEARRAIADALGKGARAGFTFPPAMLQAQIDEINRDRRNNNSRAAIDISIKQAEMEQNNLQFAVTQSANLRQFMVQSALTYFSGLVQLNGQALEYARDVADMVVKAYELAIRYSELGARLYEAEVNVYRVRLEGAMAVIQVYEAQIRAVKAQVEVDQAKVSLYSSRIAAVQAVADIYKTQVEAVQTAISIEKMKVELYAAKVNAYVSQVNGFTAEWQGYVAAVNGESAKVQGSAEEVRGYVAKVQAYEATVRARGIEIEARARANAQKLEAYRTDVEAYKALVDGTATAVATEINSYSETLKAFVAKANAISEKSRSEIAVYEVGQRGITENARLTYDYIRERDAMNVARATGASRIAEAIGGIYAGIAQSTLAGMNSLAASTQTSEATT